MLQPILNVVRLIWRSSKFYNTPDRLAGLLCKVAVASTFSATSLAGALNTANFGANRASLLVFNDGSTYLALNNGTAGWNPGTDAIIKFNFTGAPNSLTII